MGAALQPIRSTRLLLHETVIAYMIAYPCRSGLVLRMGRAAPPTFSNDTHKNAPRSSGRFV
ncbi:hypothetical protein DOH45_25570 [Salmonella enterica subsp. enterica serovar Enteritidis]|nr:hypothetical protein [Salmonella enterica subsp. enterica serovar Enteritidis]